MFAALDHYIGKYINVSAAEMAQDIQWPETTQLSEYPGTPSEGESGPDDESLPPSSEEEEQEVQCVMMSGRLEERLKFRYDKTTSVGWLRRKVFVVLQDEFALQCVDQVVLMRGENTLRFDFIKLKDRLDGPLGHTVQVLLVFDAET